MALPDDAFTIARNDEAWLFVTARAGTVTQVAGAATQVGDMIMAWKPGRGWRTVLKTPDQILGDNAWRGAYDPVRDRFLIPTTKNGFVWTIIGGNGTDQTLRSPSGAPQTQGNGLFWVSGLAVDLSRRKGYLYDHAKMEIWEADLDTLAIRQVAKLPDTPLTGTDSTRIIWHPDLRAVVVNAGKMHAFEVDTGKLTTWPRPDVYLNAKGNRVRSSTIIYDPDTSDVVAVGSIDWETGTIAQHYWRISISR